MAESNPDLETFRAEARAWLEENFPSSLKGRGAELVSGEFVDPSAGADFTLWCQRLGEKGWGTPTWPTEYGGGGLSQREAGVLQKEMMQPTEWREEKSQKCKKRTRSQERTNQKLELLQGI